MTRLTLYFDFDTKEELDELIKELGGDLDQWIYARITDSAFRRQYGSTEMPGGSKKGRKFKRQKKHCLKCSAAVIVGQGGQNHYCPPCRVIRHREIALKWWRTNRQKKTTRTKLRYDGRKPKISDTELEAKLIKYFERWDRQDAQ